MTSYVNLQCKLSSLNVNLSLRYPDLTFPFTSKKAVTPAWYQIFLRGIGCNWLVCIAVWVRWKHFRLFRRLSLNVLFQQAAGAKDTFSKVNYAARIG